jgi:phospholipase/lecithinase/hemolysin
VRTLRPTLETLENRVVPSFVVFGDSLSDVGNKSLSNGNADTPSPPYYEGRFSNGPLWVETLATYLGVPPLQPSLSSGTDYAWGGAQVAIPGFPPSIPQQITQYLNNLTAAGQTIAANDVFAEWSGTNDYLGTFLGASGPQTPIDPAVSASALTNALQTLVTAGAKALVINDLPLLGNIPYIKATDAFYQQGGALVASANAWTTAYNNDVATGLQALSGANVVLVDVAGLEEQVIQNPAHYGFTNTSDAVGPFNAPSGGLISSVTVPDPQDYFFFDGVHPTTQAQQLIGVTAAEDLGVATASVTHFSVTAPPTATAGHPFPFLVTALDTLNNKAIDYHGTVGFTSSDTQAVFSSTSATLTNGAGYFAAILESTGTRTVSATDMAASSITGATLPIAVSAAPATHFAVSAVLPTYPGVQSGPTSFATTGLPLTFTVTALDQFNNISPSYAGTVHFMGSDTAAGTVLPADAALTSGVGTFSATLATAGNQFLTATDGTINGTSSAILTRGLVVTSFVPTPSGLTITFNKPFNPSSVSMYSPAGIADDIMLATVGSQVSVRGSVVFDSDISPTSITFLKTNMVAALGTYNPSGGLLAAGNYTVTLRSLSAGNGFADFLGAALDGNNSGSGGSNFKATFSVSPPPVAVGIPDFARGPSNTEAIFLPSTIGNGNTFNLSYSNPAASPTSGTATITFSGTVATLQSNIQNALSSLPQISTTAGVPNAVVVAINDVSSGANVQNTFQNALAAAINQLLSSTTAGVSIGLASINLANNVPGNGIPVALSSGLNVTSGSFTLEYNPALLSISGAVSKISGASFTLASNTINNATSATAVLSLSSPTKISSTSAAITMGGLLATVPLSATASYGAKQLLHFSSEQLSGTAGPITVTGQDAVQVAAFFGDAIDAGGPLSLNDVNAISTVSALIPNVPAQTIPGFSAFANVDPVIIGDVALQGLGFVNATDASTINQELVSAKTAIPYAPIGLPVTPGSAPNMMSVNNSSTQPSAGLATAGGISVAPFVRVFNAPSIAVVRDFALLQALADISQPDWLSNGLPANLGESGLKRSSLIGPWGAEDTGLARLEALFALELTFVDGHTGSVSF